MIFLIVIFLFFTGTIAKEPSKCEKDNLELANLQANVSIELSSKRIELATCMEDYFATKDSYAGASCTSTYEEVSKMETFLESKPVDCSKTPSRIHITKKPQKKVETSTLAQISIESPTCSEDNEECQTCKKEYAEFEKLYQSYEKSMETFNNCQTNDGKIPIQIYRSADNFCKNLFSDYIQVKLTLLKELKNRNSCTKHRKTRSIKSTCEIANLELIIKHNDAHLRLLSMRGELQVCQQTYRDSSATSDNCLLKENAVKELEKVLEQKAKNCNMGEN